MVFSGTSQCKDHPLPPYHWCYVKQSLKGVTHVVTLVVMLVVTPVVMLVVTLVL